MGTYSEKFDKYFDEILLRESSETKKCFCTSLGLMVLGKMGLEEAALCSGITPSHYVSFLESSNVPKTPFVEGVLEELEILKNNPERKELHHFISEEIHIPTIETKAFTIIGNNVKIHADENQFRGITHSIKAAGGRYDSKSQSWYLTDEQMEAWKKSQIKYGWFK